ncbi:MAG TPA: glycosyltransferase family 39 protein, partial [Lacipirellulaceae bacterium]|nr:glycosyltransferase family 39 protein [Lacipirellulaceae bacterium]
PFLYSAAQALSLRAFGMNEAAARLPGALFALLTAVTTVLLARRMFDEETALYSGLASLTLVLPIILAQSPAHDVALVPWTNLVVLSFWEQQRAPAGIKQWKWVAMMAVFIALAFLTKGLIGVAVVGTGLGLYALVTRSITPSLTARMAVALVAGVVLASPWYLAMEHASPGYLSYYFLERHLLGYVTDGQEHSGTAWYYYVGPVIGGSMPWFSFAAAAFVQSRLDSRRRSVRPELLLACWFIGGFIFLSAAGSRLITYSLPLFPPVAILGGLCFRRYFHAELTTLPRRLFVSSFSCVAFFGVIAPIPTLYVLSKFLHSPSPWIAYVVAVLASIAMAGGFALFAMGRGRQALTVGLLWFPLVTVCLMTWPMQKLAEENSQRALAAMISKLGETPEEIILIGQRVGSLRFYLPPDQRAWYSNGRVREADPCEISTLLPPPPGALFAITTKELRRQKGEEAMRRLPFRTAGAFQVIQGVPVDLEVASRFKGNGR